MEAVFYDMKILIRVDSSSSIGLGHLMRCLVLAKQYKNDKITFFSHEIDEKLVQNSGYELIKLASKKIEDFIKAAKKQQPDLIIVDSYKIGYKEEKRLKEELTCKILVFDDTYKKHYADILLNHNIYANKSLYKNKVPAFCELRCGKKYTLIDENFKKERQKKHKKEGVLVCLGGSDPKNITLQVLKILPLTLPIKVATTSTNKHLEKLVAYSKTDKLITLHINTSIPKLMNGSLFGIITPSTIAHEALFMELPFIAIQTATNQRYMYKYLQQNDYQVLNSADSTFKKQLKEAFENRQF